MPLVTLTVRKPKSNAFKSSVLDAVHDSLVATGVPAADKFQRVHMKDFSYLSHEIQPSSSQQFWMYFCIILFGCIAWGICIYVGPNTFHQYRRY